MLTAVDCSTSFTITVSATSIRSDATVPGPIPRSDAAELLHPIGKALKIFVASRVAGGSGSLRCRVLTVVPTISSVRQKRSASVQRRVCSNPKDVAKLSAVLLRFGRWLESKLRFVSMKDMGMEALMALRRTK